MGGRASEHRHSGLLKMIRRIVVSRTRRVMIQIESLSHSESDREAVWGPAGGYGLVRIRVLDFLKLKIERKSDWTLPERFVGVLDCIVRLLLS